LRALAFAVALSFITPTAASLHAQSPAVPAQTPRLTFDVASIHPSDPSVIYGGIKPIPGGHGYTATNVPLKLMISLMYKIPQRQILDAPGWLTSEKWDVEARVDGTYSAEDLHIMFQNLIIDRFGLKFHMEKAEGNIYALTVDPSGSKLIPNPSPQDYKIPVNGGPAHTVGQRVPMNYLVWWIGQVVQQTARPIVDQTGLTGNFDFKISYQPPLPPDITSDALPPELRDLPTIFVALREQLGLRLTPTKGTYENMVIDHIDRPSAN
jgi:uncharacterized protein (TIGR03435 family)